jgi:hypothetical protein
VLPLVLLGGAHIDLVPYRYLFKVADQQYCLGVFDNGFQGTLLGGIITRNVLVQVSNTTYVGRGAGELWGGVREAFEGTWGWCSALAPCARWMVFAHQHITTSRLCHIIVRVLTSGGLSNMCLALQYDNDKKRVGFADMDCNTIQVVAQVRSDADCKDAASAPQFVGQGRRVACRMTSCCLNA